MIVQFRSCHSFVCTPFPSLFHLALLDDCAVQVLPFFCLHFSSTLLPPSSAKRLCSLGLAILLFAPLFHPSSTQLHQMTLQLSMAFSYVPYIPLWPNNFRWGSLLRALHPSSTQQKVKGWCKKRGIKRRKKLGMLVVKLRNKSKNLPSYATRARRTKI